MLRGVSYAYQEVRRLNIKHRPCYECKADEVFLLSKEKLCLYIHESLEHHGSPWKLMIANTGGGGERKLVDESTTVSQFGDLSAGDFLTDHIVIVQQIHNPSARW